MSRVRAGSKLPNILLITTDTQRTDTLACMGNPHAVSPNLDRLAAEGVLFTEAYTASPVCSPARTSLLTGVHTPIHGVIENGFTPRPGLTPFADLLAAAGYTNLMVGKTHFGPVPASFHYQSVLKGKKPGTGDDFYARRLRAQGYEKSTAFPPPFPESLCEPAAVVSETIEMIERARKERPAPFFAWCSILGPHPPFDPPERWAARYPDDALPALNYRPGEVAEHPEHLRRLVGLSDRRPEAPGFNPDGSPNWEVVNEERRRYYGLSAFCDDQVGRLIRYLDDAGLRDETLVIFTSDHGTELYDHGFLNKHNYYDSTWRVPLIVSMPGTLPQGARRSFAHWNDLTATILGAAGGESPFVQGFNLLPSLQATGEHSDSPRCCAAATLYRSCALATKRWKLEYYFEEGNGRLFDRREDPLEQRDLFHSDDHKEVRAALLEALLTWRADLVDVEAFHRDNDGGGPVARRVQSLRAMSRGVDAERRLNERVARIEARN